MGSPGKPRGFFPQFFKLPIPKETGAPEGIRGRGRVGRLPGMDLGKKGRGEGRGNFFPRFLRLQIPLGFPRGNRLFVFLGLIGGCADEGTAKGQANNRPFLVGGIGGPGFSRFPRGPREGAPSNAGGGAKGKGKVFLSIFESGIFLKGQGLRPPLGKGWEFFFLARGGQRKDGGKRKKFFLSKPYEFPRAGGPGRGAGPGGRLNFAAGLGLAKKIQPPWASGVPRTRAGVPGGKPGGGRAGQT